MQRERAATNVEGSRQADYLKDEVAIRLCERLLVNKTHREIPPPPYLPPFLLSSSPYYTPLWCFSSTKGNNEQITNPSLLSLCPHNRT